MTEWKDIKNYVGLYQISSDGRVKSLPFLQRYTHWRTGKELFRQTKERTFTANIINSGYEVARIQIISATLGHVDGGRLATDKLSCSSDQR